MSKLIRIRNVSEALYRRLRWRAAAAGMSFSDSLLAELRRTAGRPTPEELLERLRSRSRVEPPIPPARAVREERDAASPSAS
jgi:plasmid stability protein